MCKNQCDKHIGFLLIGGIHHILHLLPPIAELNSQTAIKPVLYVRTETERIQCQRLLDGLGVAPPVPINILNSPAIFRRLSPKLSDLLFNYKTFKQLNALIVAERTSTILRYMPGRLPCFIHIPHGAGDRAKSYDKRIRHFDHVIVAGQKDKERMIRLGLLTHENCHVSGYLKPYALKSIPIENWLYFNNDKPIVLYNPHFSHKLSSWHLMGKTLLELFAQNTDFNFIVAPHIRLFANHSTRKKQIVEAYNQYEHIHIDLGSERSTNMSYTKAAHIYMGDVSSQIYEFLWEHPKPCLFLNPSQMNWQNNPDFAHWSFGKIITHVDNVMTALYQAYNDHPQFESLQRQRVIAALGEPDWNPIKRAADIITKIITSKS